MKRIKSLVAVVFAAVVAISSIAPAISASAASASLSIVPRKNYTIEPGDTVRDTMVIRNLDANETLNLTLRTVDFTFNDDGGTPKLMLAEDAPQTTWSLKPFLKTPDFVTVPPKGSKTLDVSVSIPSGQGAGSYYSAIVYSSSSDTGGNVGLSASGVTLVFVSVPGVVNEKLTLEKFGAYDLSPDAQTGQYVFMSADAPEAIAYTLKNDGNVAEAPVGSIKLKHIFGPEYNITNVNPNSSLALIGQSRTFTSCIKLKTQDVEFEGSSQKTKTCDDPGLWPGYYTVSLDLFYGQNGNKTQEITGTTGYWYLPWWFVITSLILLAALGLFIWSVVRKIKGKVRGARVKRTMLRRRR